MLRRLSCALIPALAFLASAPALSPAAMGQQPPKKPKVVFFDDFSGLTLDRTKWNVIVHGAGWRTVNNEQQAYVDSPETISIVSGEQAEGAERGALLLRPHYRKGFVTPDKKTFDFISGRIDTQGKVEVTYGTVAARMKLPAGSGLWPAFWMLGGGRWPATGEIDIMENVGFPDWVNSALHGPGYSGNTPLVKRFSLPKDRDVTAWHVYSVDWTPDTLVFKVDGTEYYRVTREMVEKHGRWAFDNPKYVILNFALGGGYPQGVNRVTSPYPGLPEETVQLLKEGKPRVLVDWVRITRE